MSNGSAEQASEDFAARERAVIDFLNEQPDLLRRHPELLDRLELPGNESAAVSLVEYQLRRARLRLAELEEQLKSLIGIARANETLLLRVHQMHLKLGSSEGQDLLDKLDRALRADFAIDAWCIVMAELPAGLAHPCLRSARGEPVLEALLAGSQPQSGRLTAAKRRALFGEIEIATAAFSPLPAGGLLALGSSDPARFTPDADTLLLKLLGLTLAQRLPLASNPEAAAG